MAGPQGQLKYGFGWPRASGKRDPCIYVTIGDYIGNRCLDILSLFLHFKVKLTVLTYAVVHPCTPIHYTCTPAHP